MRASLGLESLAFELGIQRYMKVLPFTRWLWLGLCISLLLTATTTFANTDNNTKATEKKYDTKQLIRDIAILYRQQKLEQRAANSSKTPLATVSYTPVKPLTKLKSGKSSLSKKHKKKNFRKASFKKKRSAKRRLAKRKSKPRLKRGWKNLKRKRSDSYRNSMMVTATAYTSHVNQTDSTPNIAAWGDRLSPGMKVIAVSRDMLTKYGLKHRSRVRIKGLKGEYRVLDKMNKRWRKKIDIYMGMDLKKAFKWGRRRVELQWN